MKAPARRGDGRLVHRRGTPASALRLDNSGVFSAAPMLPWAWAEKRPISVSDSLETLGHVLALLLFVWCCCAASGSAYMAYRTYVTGDTSLQSEGGLFSRGPSRAWRGRAGFHR